jgi:hypothetical protein
LSGLFVLYTFASNGRFVFMHACADLRSANTSEPFVGWHPEFSEEGGAKRGVTQAERDRQSVTLELPGTEGQVVGDV